MQIVFSKGIDKLDTMLSALHVGSLSIPNIGFGLKSRLARRLALLEFSASSTKSFEPTENLIFSRPAEYLRSSTLQSGSSSRRQRTHSQKLTVELSTLTLSMLAFGLTVFRSMTVSFLCTIAAMIITSAACYIILLLCSQAGQKMTERQRECRKVAAHCGGYAHMAVAVLLRCPGYYMFGLSLVECSFASLRAVVAVEGAALVGLLALRLASSCISMKSVPSTQSPSPTTKQPIRVGRIVRESGEYWPCRRTTEDM